jgi:hypothetical protein
MEAPRGQVLGGIHRAGVRSEPGTVGVNPRRFWRLVHNCIAHPLLELLPERWGTWLHDRTARLAFE